MQFFRNLQDLIKDFKDKRGQAIEKLNFYRASTLKRTAIKRWNAMALLINYRQKGFAVQSLFHHINVFT